MSIKLGKPKLKDGKEITAPIVETEKPAKPAKTDDFDDDIPFNPQIDTFSICQ